MTVKELKLELEKYPDNMDIFIDERVTEFTYGLLNSVNKKKIDFFDDISDSTPLSCDICIVLSEE